MSASETPSDQVHTIHEHLAPRLDGLSLTAGEKEWEGWGVLCQLGEERGKRREEMRGEEYVDEVDAG